MAESASGILAIWNDCKPGHEAEFEEWYQHEHFFERIGVPGFLLGRRYEAVSGAPRYFCFYVTQTPDVLGSAAYRARLDAPTPMTRKIMAEAFSNMSRTVCHRTARRGAMWGAAAVAVRFTTPPVGSELEAQLTSLSRDKAVAGGEVWTAADAGIPVSEEERLRGGDAKISACLLVETLRVEDAASIADKLTARYPAATIGVYRLLCEIGSPLAR